MARLPQPGSDNGTWGDVLNDFLEQVHKADGTLKSNVVTNDAIAPGSVTSNEIAADAITATQIQDGTITEAQLDASVQSKLNAVETTRTGVFPFELPVAINTFSADQPVNNRRVFRIAQRVKRFRVHVKNRNQLADSNATGTVTNITLFVGNPATDAEGNSNGNFTTTPVQIQSTTTMASGTELITPWVMPATFTIDPYKLYLLSIGFHSPSTGQLAFGGGVTWQTLAPGDAGVIAPAGLTRVNNAAFLQIYIEYEYEDDRAPSILVVGNSISNGTNGGGMDTIGELSSWPQIWALNQRGVAASLAASGTWAAHFMSGNARWDVYSGLANPIQYDAIIYMALNSSDLAGGNLAGAKSNMTSVIAHGKSLYPNARHIITNVPPRIAFTGDGTVGGTLEYDRLRLNEWMHMLPGAVEQCIDVDSLVTDWANPARLRTPYNADDTHLTPRGHILFAQSIPDLRRSV